MRGRLPLTRIAQARSDLSPRGPPTGRGEDCRMAGSAFRAVAKTRPNIFPRPRLPHNDSKTFIQRKNVTRRSLFDSQFESIDPIWPK